MDILNKIVAYKREELKEKKELTPIKKLEKSPYFTAKPISLSKYILREDKDGVIAEFKRRSPSKPAINLYAQIEKVSIGYMQAGASAISVLTDHHFFGGSEEDLITARKYNFCPILRKDFIFDEYQVLEARSIGADAILLIAEILDKDQLNDLAKLASQLGMEVLMELHHIDQLHKLNEFINVLGVNNRNLETFQADPEHSVNLFSSLPEGIVKISESGLNNIQSMIRLTNIGYDGFLIGEKFMSSPDPVKACERFIKEFRMEKQNVLA